MRRLRSLRKCTDAGYCQNLNLVPRDMQKEAWASMFGSFVTTRIVLRCCGVSHLLSASHEILPEAPTCVFDEKSTPFSPPTSREDVGAEDGVIICGYFHIASGPSIHCFPFTALPNPHYKADLLYLAPAAARPSCKAGAQQAQLCLCCRPSGKSVIQSLA